MKEVKKMFPGIEFHRIDISSIDMDNGVAHLKAINHNLAHVIYDSASLRKNLAQVVPNTRKRLKVKVDAATAKRDSREVIEAGKRELEGWKGIVITNKVLPINLRGKHTR